MAGTTTVRHDPVTGDSGDWLMPEQSCFKPDWPLPPGVRAAMSTRLGGVSSAPFDSLNLGLHVGDVGDDVRQNRALLARELALPVEPLWLEQVHGCAVYNANAESRSIPRADAVWTDQTQRVLAIMTADCLPVLLVSQCGQVVAAAHAGWRGLAAGVLTRIINALPVPAAQLSAWLGPAIGAKKFEVGSDVWQSFVGQNAEFATHFQRCDHNAGKYLADIYGLARTMLYQAGVRHLHGGGFCTVSQRQQFFSHRRDGAASGRMAALIWRE